MPLRTAMVPTGYTDTIPSLSGVSTIAQASRILKSAGIEAFSDEANGYVTTLIEEWCASASVTTEAARELRFVIEQARWTAGYKAFGKGLLEQLPE